VSAGLTSRECILSVELGQREVINRQRWVTQTDVSHQRFIREWLAAIIIIVIIVIIPVQNLLLKDNGIFKGASLTWWLVTARPGITDVVVDDS